MKGEAQVFKVDFVQLDNESSEATALFWRMYADRHNHREYTPTKSSTSRLTATIRHMTHQRRASLLPWWDCLGWSADIKGEAS